MSEKNPQTLGIWISKIIGFVVGFSLAVLAEVAQVAFLSWLFDARLTGRGLGWVVLPIMAGAGCASLAGELGKNPAVFVVLLDSIITKLNPKNWRSGKTKRSMIFFPLLWIFFVGLYVIIFSPYGHMSSHDYHHMYKVMLFPPSVILATYFVYKKLILNTDNHEGTTHDQHRT